MAYSETEVSVSKSQDAIRKLIYAHHGTGIMFLSQPPREGFEAMVTIAETAYRIRIVAKCQQFDTLDGRGILRTKKTYTNLCEQEVRRVWRVLFFHLKALFEAADSGVIDIRDVILPYVVMKDGMTIADRLKPMMPQLMNIEPKLLLTS